MANKTVVDNRLPAPSLSHRLDFNLKPSCGAAPPVAGATPRRWPRSCMHHTITLFVASIALLIAPHLSAADISTDMPNAALEAYHNAMKKGGRTTESG